MRSATGVVLNWKRTQNMPQIVRHMLSTDWIRAVLVWSNNREEYLTLCEELQEFGDRVCVINSRDNLYTLGRYYAASRATTDLIATCDDDVLVGDWDALLESHLSNGRIACYLDPGHARWAHTKYVHKFEGGTAYETLLGYGAVFHKDALRAIEKYRAHGKSAQLLLRKADRIFTILQGCPHNILETRVHHLPGAQGAEALYQMEDHWKLNREAVETCKSILESECVSPSI